MAAAQDERKLVGVTVKLTTGEIEDLTIMVKRLGNNRRGGFQNLLLHIPYSDKSNINRWSHTAGKDLRCRGNNWFIPYKTIVSRSKERPHPATFPVELAENCIRIHGRKANLVMMDPFLGIGHSALAAKKCAIKHFIGFEIDSEYMDVAVRAVDKGFTEPTAELRKYPRQRQKQNASEGTLFDPSVFS